MNLSRTARLLLALVSGVALALALGQVLQEKKFPVFVITLGAGKYYRVHVGPYSNAQAATSPGTNRKTWALDPPSSPEVFSR